MVAFKIKHDQSKKNYMKIKYNSFLLLKLNQKKISKWFSARLWTYVFFAHEQQSKFSF